MLGRLSAFLLAAVLASAPASDLARAQRTDSPPRVEITPVLGYRTDSEFSNGSYPVDDSVGVSDLEIEHSASYGLTLDLTLHENWQVQFLYSRQPTELQYDEPNRVGAPRKLFDLDVDSIMFGGLYQWGRFYDRTRAFAALQLGGTRFSTPQAVDSETKFAGGFTTGAKINVDSRWSVRLQGRWISTYIGSNPSDFCSVLGCWTADRSVVVRQLEFGAGITLKL